MKPIKTFLLLLLSLIFVGCAANKEYMAMLAAQQSIATQQSSAAVARFKAMETIAATGDPTSKSVAVMAMAMVQMPTVNLPPPPVSETLQWASVLVPSITALGTGYFGYQLGVAQSDNQRLSTVASYSTFGQMGSDIRAAGVAGYPFIQAPQPNNILSGTGVIGSGSYIGPVSRTCSTGAGAPGGAGGVGTTTGGAGASGGSSGPASC